MIANNLFRPVGTGLALVRLRASHAFADRGQPSPYDIPPEIAAPISPFMGQGQGMGHLSVIHPIQGHEIVIRSTKVL